jgi:hypothetical protein
MAESVTGATLSSWLAADINVKIYGIENKENMINANYKRVIIFISLPLVYDNQ